MKRNWHTLAARVAAEHPHWSWSQVCAHVARRSPKRQPVPKLTVAEYAARLEQRKLF